MGQAACWRSTPRVPCAQPAKWPRSSAIFPRLSPTRESSAAGWTSRSTNSVMNSLAILCRTASRWTAFLKSAWTKACANATAHRPNILCSPRPAHRSSMSSSSSPNSDSPVTSSSSGTLSATASRTGSSCRDAVQRPTPPFATRSKSPPSIRLAWSCSSSAFSTRTAASGPTSTSTCPPGISANR